MSLIYTNACSLYNKLSELKSIVFENNIDIICITETHLGDHICDDEISIPNYELFRANRNAYGGGSIIYTYVKLKASFSNSVNVKDC